MREVCPKCENQLDWIDPELSLGYCFACGIPAYPDARGTEITAAGPSAQAIARMREMAVAAGAYYRAQLEEPAGARARAYIKERNIRQESVNRFGLGYAPPGLKCLQQHLAALGYTEKEIVAAGFAAPAEDGQIQDHIRDRLVFPLHNPAGHLVAFSGRLLTERRNAPKYLNTLSSAIYRRNFILFNSHRAARSNMPYWILAEGYTDVVSLDCHGFSNTVCTMGTALNDVQVKVIASSVNEVVILFDGDGPGVSAMYRAAEKLEESGITVSGHILPGKHDPDSYLKKNGAGRLRHELDIARQSMAPPWFPGAPVSDREYLLNLCRKAYSQE